MQRLPDHDDGALSVGRDHDDVARVRFVTLCSVNVRARGCESRFDLACRVVAAECSEQVHLCVAPAELKERDATAAAREHPRRLDVCDLTGSWNGVDTTEGDVFDVSDDGNAQR
jgi:hypothetical protein